MAVEPLEYKVTFDTSEIAQKISEVKNQMDIALGAQAFGQSGLDPYPMSQMFEAPSFASNALNAARSGYQSFQGDLNNMQNLFTNMAQNSRVGMNKFTEGAELRGLTTRAAEMFTRSPGGSYESTKAQIADMGVFSSGLGAMGIGYSQRMPMDRGEFGSLSSARFAENLMDPSWGGFATAVGAGSTLGWAGAGVAAAGYAGYSAMNAMATGYRREKSVGNFARGTSFRFLSGEFSGSEAKDIGSYTRGLERSDMMLGKEYDAPEMDMAMREFTGAGGFDNVRSAEQYKQTTKKFFEDHRAIMHALKATSEEAAQMMGQMSSELGVNDMGAFAANVSALAPGMGMRPKEVVGFMGQASEMARGSGFGMADSGMAAANMLHQVRYMQKSGILSDEDVRQQGGAAQMALSMTRSGMNYASSPFGMVSNIAAQSSLLGGANPMTAMGDMSINEQLSRAAGMMSTPLGLFGAIGSQGAMKDAMGVEWMAQEETLGHLKQASMMGIRFKNTEQFEGYLITQGLTPAEAKTQSSIATTGPEYYRQRSKDRISASLKEKYGNAPSSFAKDMDAAGNAIGNVWDATVGGASSWLMGEIEEGIKSSTKTGMLSYFSSDSSKEKAISAMLDQSDDLGISYGSRSGEAILSLEEKKSLRGLGLKGLTGKDGKFKNISREDVDKAQALYKEAGKGDIENIGTLIVGLEKAGADIKDIGSLREYASKTKDPTILKAIEQHGEEKLVLGMQRVTNNEQYKEDQKTVMDVDTRENMVEKIAEGLGLIDAQLDADTENVGSSYAEIGGYNMRSGKQKADRVNRIRAYAEKMGTTASGIVLGLNTNTIKGLPQKRAGALAKLKADALTELGTKFNDKEWEQLVGDVNHESIVGVEVGGALDILGEVGATVDDATQAATVATNTEGATAKDMILAKRSEKMQSFLDMGAKKTGSYGGEGTQVAILGSMTELIGLFKISLTSGYFGMTEDELTNKMAGVQNDPEKPTGP